MENSFKTVNGTVRIVDRTIQIESSVLCGVRRLFRRSKITFAVAFTPIVWALVSLVIDHWLFPAGLGGLFLAGLIIILFFIHDH
jgi:hypothetical protein